MNIHQVSVRYHPEHDRLLLLINTQSGEELRLWLTRRLTFGLMPILTGRATEQMSRLGQASPLEPGASLEAQRQSMLDAFHREAAAYASDFDTPYEAPKHSLDNAPLPEPLLISEVALTLLVSGQLEMKLTEKLDEVATTREVEVAMPAQMTQGLLHLLGKGLQQSAWLTVPTQAPGLSVGDGDAGEAGSGNAADKPVYLN